MALQPFPHHRLRVLPLKDRKSLTDVQEILIDPDSSPPPLPDHLAQPVATTATAILEAKRRGSTILLFYGAHLLRNGAPLFLDRMMERGWITHLATNGAGTIHDWEYAYLGRSTESVRENVATGTFGTWDETGRSLHLALLAGGIDGLGYGESLGRWIHHDGALLPDRSLLEKEIREDPLNPLTPARADLLQAYEQHRIPTGPIRVEHPWKQASIVAAAYRHNCPLTVHPGIGYDIIANHPMFNGAVIGRAAAVDFTRICGSIEGLDHGVVLSIGSAIMAPQVFEKALSCVNNVRLQDGRGIVQDHRIAIVDLQDGGRWDWSQGEPPKDHPAYYLRFCKSFARMGGAMAYLQCDNMVFLRNLVHRLALDDA